MFNIFLSCNLWRIDYFIINIISSCSRICIKLFGEVHCCTLAWRINWRFFKNHYCDIVICIFWVPFVTITILLPPIRSRINSLSCCLIWNNIVKICYLINKFTIWILDLIIESYVITLFCIFLPICCINFCYTILLE